jgi:hypothetical protein
LLTRDIGIPKAGCFLVHLEHVLQEEPNGLPWCSVEVLFCLVAEGVRTAELNGELLQEDGGRENRYSQVIVEGLIGKCPQASSEIYQGRCTAIRIEYVFIY